MDEYAKLKQLKAEVEKERKTQYKNDSKERLAKIVTTKLKTTMIGAIAAVERHLDAFLQPDENGKINTKYREAFDKIRQDILDNGNNQIRNVLSEIDQYDIEWLRYRYTLPVKPYPYKEEKNEE